MINTADAKDDTKSKLDSKEQALRNLLITKNDVTWPGEFWNSFKMYVKGYDAVSNPKIKNGIAQEFVTFYDNTKQLTKNGIRIDIMELNDSQQAFHMFQSMQENLITKTHTNSAKNNNCYMSTTTEQFRSGSAYVCVIERYLVILRVQLPTDSLVSSQDVSDQVMNIINKKIKSNGKIKSDVKIDDKKTNVKKNETKKPITKIDTIKKTKEQKPAKKSSMLAFPNPPNPLLLQLLPSDEWYGDNWETSLPSAWRLQDPFVDDDERASKSINQAILDKTKTRPNYKISLYEIKSKDIAKQKFDKLIEYFNDISNFSKNGFNFFDTSDINARCFGYSYVTTNYTEIYCVKENIALAVSGKRIDVETQQMVKKITSEIITDINKINKK